MPGLSMARALVQFKVHCLNRRRTFHAQLSSLGQTDMKWALRHLMTGRLWAGGDWKTLGCFGSTVQEPFGNPLTTQTFQKFCPQDVWTCLFYCLVSDIAFVGPKLLW